jgi:hypothetical protein
MESKMKLSSGVYPWHSIFIQRCLCNIQAWLCTQCIDMETLHSHIKIYKQIAKKQIEYSQSYIKQTVKWGVVRWGEGMCVMVINEVYLILHDDYDFRHC